MMYQLKAGSVDASLGDGFILGADYFDRHDGLHFDYDAMRIGFSGYHEPYQEKEWRHPSSGGNTIVIVLILAALALAGGAGFYFYMKRKLTKDLLTYN